MFTRDEREEIRQILFTELGVMERQITESAGSYHYLCRIMGVPVFTHQPAGTVLRHF